MSEPCEVALPPDSSQSFILIHKESVKFALHMHVKEKRKNRINQNCSEIRKMETTTSFTSKKKYQIIIPRKTFWILSYVFFF